MKIEFSVQELLNIEKSAHRNALVDCGIYQRPVHKVHKNKKNYFRTPKHKKAYEFS
jgi:hypothetical protein